ncbi:hypothetical protein SLL00_04835 [Metabacillus indicus]|uniref:hypothetical protein n=1 Tax=Metabacillus indicus TaxID=246786 RepID=UPI002A066B45|nr:hypothetical protein [Metabacillus indicus]MDX8289102.1 hypothetical protein [Metabacillus indicus]
MFIIHDSRILTYQVDLENACIEMKAVDEFGSKAMLLFDDVFAYYFENQLPGSILFDITVGEINDFAEDHKELLKESKDYGWPMDYRNAKELTDHIKKNEYTYYIVEASYGLNGWILARGMRTEECSS